MADHFMNQGFYSVGATLFNYNSISAPFQASIARIKVHSRVLTLEVVDRSNAHIRSDGYTWIDSRSPIFFSAEHDKLARARILHQTY